MILIVFLKSVTERFELLGPLRGIFPFLNKGRGCRSSFLQKCFDDAPHSVGAAAKRPPCDKTRAIPNGVLEEEIVATIAHLAWRRRNLATLRIAERAQQHVTQIRNEMMLMDHDAPRSDKSDDFDKIFTEKWCAAESKAREELGEAYSLVEMGEAATVGGLVRGLEVQARLDAMIDKCLKRLLFLRGLKSLTIESSSSPPPRLTGPSKVA